MTHVSVEVTTKSYTCIDAECFDSLLNDVVIRFKEFITSETLTTKIVAWAYEREPPVKQLWEVTEVNDSFQLHDSTNLYVTMASSSVGFEVMSGGSFEVNLN